MATPDNGRVANEEHVLAGRYAVRQQLSDDGLILICRAVDQALGRDVGVRILTPEASQDLIETFRRETERAALVRHPNVCSVLDYVPPGDRPPFSVVQIVDAPNLRDWLRQRGTRLSNEEVRLVALQILAAVACGHDQGVVHGGLAPEHVQMVPPTDAAAVQHDVPKVSGYGLASVTQAAASRRSGIGAQGSASPCLSPEQRRGEHASLRSDVYASGCLLYLLATGKMPVIDPSTGRGSPTAPSLLNPAIATGLDEVVLTALDQDPARRHTDARALREAFGKATQAGARKPGPDTLRPGPKAAPAAVAAANHPSRMSAAEAGAALAAALDEDTQGVRRPAAGRTPGRGLPPADVPPSVTWENPASEERSRRRLFLIAAALLVIALLAIWFASGRELVAPQVAGTEPQGTSPTGTVTTEPGIARDRLPPGTRPHDLGTDPLRPGAGLPGQDDPLAGPHDETGARTVPNDDNARPTIMRGTQGLRRRMVRASRRAREGSPGPAETAGSADTTAPSAASQPSTEPQPVAAPVAEPNMNSASTVGDIEGNPYLH